MSLPVFGLLIVGSIAPNRSVSTIYNSLRDLR